MLVEKSSLAHFQSLKLIRIFPTVFLLNYHWRYIKFGDLVIEHEIAKLKIANIFCVLVG